MPNYDNIIINLPGVVMTKIIKFLSFKDRLKCRLVCRSWRNRILLKQNQPNLFVHFDLFPYNIRDSYSGELIKYENSIQLKNFRFLESELTRMYFKNLKKLNIFNIEHYERTIVNLGNCVNHFTELEVLSLTKFRLKETSKLNFSKLRVLILKHIQIDQKLELNTCSLDTLICWSNIEKIYFHYPSKLINLELKHSRLDFAQEFRNLESLKYFNETGLSRKDFLGNLRKLRNLAIYTPFFEHDLKELNRQKNYFEMKKLQISSFGFKDKLIYFPINHHYIYLLDKFILKKLFDNYSNLTTCLSFPVQIDFCSTIDKFLHIPNDFFRKFSQIAQVNVGWNSKDLIHNFASLIKFIENCGFLPKLMLNNCALKQDFYDQLSLNSSIGQLDIEEFNLNFKSYHFLSRLVLFHLKVHLNSLPVDLLRNALINKNAKYFEFHQKNTKIYIKYDRNLFNLEINHQFVTKFHCFDSLLNYLQNDNKVSHLLC